MARPLTPAAARTKVGPVQPHQMPSNGRHTVRTTADSRSSDPFAFSLWLVWFDLIVPTVPYRSCKLSGGCCPVRVGAVHVSCLVLAQTCQARTQWNYTWQYENNAPHRPASTRYPIGCNELPFFYSCTFTPCFIPPSSNRCSAKLTTIKTSRLLDLRCYRVRRLGHRKKTRIASYQLLVHQDSICLIMLRI